MNIVTSRTKRWLSRKQAFTLIDSLKECTTSKDLEGGKKLHAEATSKDLDQDVFLASALVNMYSKCGQVSEARKVFDSITQPDVVLWNSLLLGYVDNEQGELALELFHRMHSQGRCQPTPRTYSTALKACTLLAARETGKEVNGKLVKPLSLKHGTVIHTLVTTQAQSSDLFVSSGLVNMYAKCGSLVDSRSVFDRMPLHDMVSWTSLIMGYAENGEELTALEFFYNSPDVHPDATAYVAALKACACLAVKEDGREVDGRVVKVEALEKGTAVHSQAMGAGYGVDLFVGSMLVDMYCKCRSVVNAQRVFDRMPCHNLVTWTSLMLGYSDVEEDGERALGLFSRMHSLGSSQPDGGTFVSALKACTSLSLKEEGWEVDGKVVKSTSLERGRELHRQARECGCETDVSVAVSLVEMYSKCGSLVEARRVFESLSVQGIVPWTVLTLGYAENGEAELALEMFSKAQDGVELDSTAFLAVLKACTSLGLKEPGVEVNGKLVKLKALEKGMTFHSLALKKGFESSSYVGTSLIDMYAKCGSMIDSRGVFDRMGRNKSVTSWNALLLGYVESGEESLVLELLGCMHKGEEDRRTFVIGLKACGGVASLGTTRDIHASIYTSGLEGDELLTATLVDSYGKCGCMTEAQVVFDASVSRDLVTWTALIAGYSRGGQSEQVFSRYREMAEEGLKANAVTLLCLLTACSHAGLVEEGRRYFGEMTTASVVPCVEHYVCMVDMLSRGNRFEEAVEMVERTPVEGRAVAWMTVLSGCWKWKNVKVGKVAFERLVELDDKQSAAYDLMANIYGSSNMTEEQSSVERLKAGRLDYSFCNS